MTEDKILVSYFTQQYILYKKMSPSESLFWIILLGSFYTHFFFKFPLPKFISISLQFSNEKLPSFYIYIYLIIIN